MELDDCLTVNSQGRKKDLKRKDRHGNVSVRRSVPALSPLSARPKLELAFRVKTKRLFV